MLAIKGGKIYTIENGIIEDGIILIENGKIKKVGKDVEIPEGSEIIDAKGKHILPGFIDGHTHIGIGEVGIREEGADYNDYEALSPHFRAIDGINPYDKGFEYARAGGVTTCGVAPGSANPIGGSVCAIKTAGKIVDEMIVKNPVGIKIAFGENPKYTGMERKRTPYTRMGVAALIREALTKALNYKKNLEWSKKKDEKPPDKDLFCESLIPVIERKIPLRAHAHRADDIATAIRIAKEFNLKIVIEHGTEAHLIADFIAKEGVPVLLGPTMGTPSKIETQKLTFKAAKILRDAGVKFGIITDHDVIGIHYLLMCATLAVKEGLDEDTALRAITLTPAEILGINDRVGSIKEGKDADIVIMSGEPFDVRSKVEKTIINGKIVFDIEKDKTPW